MVAVEDEELGRLDKLERRGIANSVPRLRRLRGDEIVEIEPNARGVAALHSPATGVIDFVAVATSYAADMEAAGGSLHLGTTVHRALPRDGGLAIERSAGTTVAKQAVFCAGLWSDRLAVACGAPADPRIVPFRGGYLKLAPAQAELFRANVYPVPDPDMPFSAAASPQLRRRRADRPERPDGSRPRRLRPAPGAAATSAKRCAGRAPGR